jgi:hypothetical protein
LSPIPNSRRGSKTITVEPGDDHGVVDGGGVRVCVEGGARLRVRVGRPRNRTL